MSANIDQLNGVLGKYMAGQLARFRADLEEGTGQPISDLQINAALLLSDLCRFLGLDEQQHNHVLGANGIQHVMQVLETRVLVRMALPPVLHRSAVETVGGVVASLPGGHSQ